MTRAPKRKPRTFKGWIPRYSIEGLEDGAVFSGAFFIVKRVPATREMVGPLTRATLTLTGKGK